MIRKPDDLLDIPTMVASNEFLNSNPERCPANMRAKLLFRRMFGSYEKSGKGAAKVQGLRAPRFAPGCPVVIQDGAKTVSNCKNGAVVVAWRAQKQGKADSSRAVKDFRSSELKG